MNMQEALDLIKIKPDLKITQSDSILFIHRDLNEGSVYFISNQKTKTVKIEPEFRIAGKVPELWDPVSGSRRSLNAYSQIDGKTIVPLELAPMESAFIVFRKKADPQTKPAAAINFPAPLKVLLINTPWLVQFDNKLRGPVAPVVFKTLTDWSVNLNDSIRFYSGPALYNNTFQWKKIKKGEQVFLNLGMVNIIAKVKINGVELGGAWTAPYKIDVTSTLKKGKNVIEIKVVNTWVNRLIGDSGLPGG
jgi:hypothetical protein